MTTRPDAVPQRRGKWQRVVRDYRLNRQLYLIIVPIFIGFVIFRFVPLGGLIIAFKDYNFVDGLFGSPWVGLENFQQVVNDPYFGRVVANTFILGILIIAIAFPLPILLALALNELRHLRFKSTIQSLTYLPHFVSTVVLVGIFLDLFSTTGLINQILTGLGLPSARFLSSEEWFRPLFLTNYIWATLGWGTILYLAALAAIPPEHYEAAMMDGASRLQQMRYITLPGILPVILITFILAVGQALRGLFERVYFFQTPGTYAVSDILDTYVYRRGIKELNYSYAAAVGLINSVFILLLVWTTNWVVTRNSDRRGLW
jgi:putative aldouronate transport system permease protein